MKFQKGDMVEVFRRELRSRVDWCSPQMDAYLDGGFYKIIDTGTYRKSDGNLAFCYLLSKEEERGWWFPEHCLRLAKGYTPPTKQELVCIKIRQMYEKRKEAGYAF